MPKISYNFIIIFYKMNYKKKYIKYKKKYLKLKDLIDGGTKRSINIIQSIL